MRIRKFTESDFQDLYDTISDPEVMRYIEPSYSRERTEEFLFNAGLGDNPLIYAAENDEGEYCSGWIQNYKVRTALFLFLISCSFSS